MQSTRMTAARAAATAETTARQARSYLSSTVPSAQRAAGLDRLARVVAASPILRDCPECGGAGGGYAAQGNPQLERGDVGRECSRCDGTGSVPVDRCDCGAPNPIAVVDGLPQCSACIDASDLLGAS